MSDAEGAPMRRALALARLGWGHTAPNPLVGAVVVAQDGGVVGDGYHARFGGPHAERVALDAAGARARGGTLFVTLEPCTHTGKTPPCVDAIIAAGVAKVVVATRDPNPEAAGGVERLRSAGIAVEMGPEADEARELNAPFFHAFGSDRPWVTLKLAVSIDGAIADATRRRGWLTGPQALTAVHEMRARQDAIAVGLGTVLADDPRLTVRDVSPPRVPPMRVVFDSRLRTPLMSTLVTTAHDVPTVIVARDDSGPSVAALGAAGVDIVVAVTIQDACRALRARGVRALMVEGGARLAGSFLRAGCVDRLVTFQAPVVLGEGALNAFAFAPPGTMEAAYRLPVIERRPLGGDLMTIFAMEDRSPGVTSESPCSPD